MKLSGILTASVLFAVSFSANNAHALTPETQLATSAQPADEDSADPAPGIAALDLVAVKGVDAAVAQLLNEAVLSRLKESGRFSSIIGSSDIQAMLTLEEQKTAVGCDDESCLAQLGGALGVPYLFQATVGKVGGRLLLNLKIVHVDEARVADRLTKVFADEGELLDGLNPALDRVVLGALGPPNDAPAVPKLSEAPASPVASATAPSPETVPKAQPQLAASPSSRLHWLRGGSVIAAAAVVGMGAKIYFDGEQQQFDTVGGRTSDDFQRLDQAERNANLTAGLGFGLLALGGWLLW